MLEPKKIMRLPVKIVNMMIPVLAILSTAGLFLEFTSYGRYAFKAGQILDIIFLTDFIFRLFSYPAKKYFFKDYGWLDLLGALPVLLLFLGYEPLYVVVRAYAAGRITDMLKMLRLARLFSLIRLMNSNSEYVCKRIKKIAAPVIVIAILSTVALGYYIEKSGMFTNGSPDLFDEAMLAAMAIAVIGILFVNFYIGRILKGDLKIMSLMIDSINAGEFDLLKMASANCDDEFKSWHDELNGLLKLTSALIMKMEENDMMKHVFQMDAGIQGDPADITNSLEKIEGLLKDKSIIDDEYIKKIAGSTSLHTVKLSAKMIIDILKNNRNS